MKSIITATLRAIILFSSVFLLSISKAEADGDYYRIQLIIKTNSDYTTIKPLPPWDQDWSIVETKIIKPKKKQDRININQLHISSAPFDDTPKEVEFTIYFKAQTEDLEFVITKGDIGSTTVEAFNICSEKRYRIGKYTNSDSDGEGNSCKYEMPLKKIIKFGTVKMPLPQEESE